MLKQEKYNPSVGGFDLIIWMRVCCRWKGETNVSCKVHTPYQGNIAA